MPEQKTESILTLALTGFLSGILTCALSFLEGSLGRVFFSPSDLVFGFAIAWYFWRFRGVRDHLRLTAFVFGSVLAYQAAAATAMFSPPLRIFFGFSVDNADLLPSDKFFFGGFVGAILLFGCAYFFLSSERRPKGFILDALGLSIVGGALAILGYFGGPFLGWLISKPLGVVHSIGVISENTLNAIRGNTNAYSLLIVWQTGMAVLLGGVLPGQNTNGNHERTH